MECTRTNLVYIENKINTEKADYYGRINVNAIHQGIFLFIHYYYYYYCHIIIFCLVFQYKGTHLQGYKNKKKQKKRKLLFHCYSTHVLLLLLCFVPRDPVYRWFLSRIMNQSK